MTRATRSALALALAVPLLLTACGGGSDARAELLDQLRTEAVDSGAPAEVVDCVMSAMEDLNEEQLTSLLDDTATEETQAVVVEAMSGCAPAE